MDVMVAGLGRSTPLVKACVRTWKRQNPNWDIRLLTAADLPQLLDGDPALEAVRTKRLPPEAFSNLVRLGLLLRYGGVWADATTYCLKPLDRWIDEAAKSGFFAFANPGQDRMLSSWFLAARPNLPLLKIWQDYCIDYWRCHEERHTYFWFHGVLFSKAYEENGQFREIWDNTIKISADGPHHFNPCHKKLVEPFFDKDWFDILNSNLQLIKLTHKLPEGAMEPGRAIPYLLEKAAQKEGLKGALSRLLPTFVGTVKFDDIEMRTASVRFPRHSGRSIYRFTL